MTGCPPRWQQVCFFVRCVQPFYQGLFVLSLVILVLFSEGKKRDFRNYVCLCAHSNV